MKILNMVILGLGIVSLRSDAMEGNEVKIHALKSQRRAMERAHDELLKEYLAECPKYNTFTVMEKLFYPSWIKQCHAKLDVINNSKKNLEQMDKSVKELKQQI